MVATIALILLAQGKKSMVKIKEPFIAGQREMILGVCPHRVEAIGLYHTMSSGLNPKQAGNILFGNDNYSSGQVKEIPASPVTEEVRIGSTSWSCKKGVLGDKLGWFLDSEASRNQHVEVPITRSQNYVEDIRNLQKHSYFLDENGKIVSESAEVTNVQGHWTLDATFHETTYDVVRKGPDGERKMTITPGCGMDKLQAVFTPMIKGQDVILKEKEFYLLDPYTGGPQKYVAKVFGKFSGKFFRKEYEGRTILITGPTDSILVYLSYEGELMKIDSSDNIFLHIEEEPEVAPTLRHRKDGGD